MPTYSRVTGSFAETAPVAGEFLAGTTTGVDYGTAVVANTAWTAKGDLVSATAASTPAALAVGEDGEALVADSGEDTGLKWDGPFIAASTVAAKGDIMTGTAAATPAVLTAGTDGKALLADSGEDTGLKWGAVVRPGVATGAAAGKVLATDGIGVGNSAAGNTLGTVVKKVPFYDVDGTTVLGYVPLYDAITTV